MLTKYQAIFLSTALKQTKAGPRSSPFIVFIKINLSATSLLHGDHKKINVTVSKACHRPRQMSQSTTKCPTAHDKCHSRQQISQLPQQMLQSATNAPTAHYKCSQSTTNVLAAHDKCQSKQQMSQLPETHVTANEKYHSCPPPPDIYHSQQQLFQLPPSHLD